MLAPAPVFANLETAPTGARQCNRPFPDAVECALLSASRGTEGGSRIDGFDHMLR
jgi:hypothetical protein